MASIGLLAIAVAVVGSAMMAWRGWQLHRRRPGVTRRHLINATLVMVLGATVAFATLLIAILSHDFSIAYVARHTSTTTPFIFLLASGWAALEGSIVLWGLVLAVFAYAAVRQVGRKDGLGALAMAIVGVVSLFWFGLMATVANPFAVCVEAGIVGCDAQAWSPLATSVAAADGLGPNPLLQNHILMAVHPPMLYLGYVGFTIPYAFAMAALIRGERGKAWLDRTHRWSMIAWSFLTFGILLGAWWSYEVLGWGGYWAWDPVENAAFLPWLVATAFIHSAIVQRRRGMLQAWNFALVISTFALTILGTFLTRSGVVASVHSFTQSPVGPALLAFLGLVVIGSFTIFALRVHLVASSPRLDSLASREGLFLANNLLLTVFALTVLIGTMYPLLVEGFSGQQVSVGRPFFDRVTLPIAFALLLAMGLGPITPYRKANPEIVWDRIRTPIRWALVAGAIAVLAGIRSVPTVLIFVLAAFVIAAIVREFSRQASRLSGEHGSWSVVGILLRRDAGFWGGQIAHIGFALVAVAVAATTALAVRGEIRLQPGEAEAVSGYCLEYVEPFVRDEPNRQVEGARVVLMDEGCSETIRTIEPRLNRYPGSAQPVVTPEVRTGLFEDVYVSLAGGNADEVVLDVFVFPGMWLLWFGGTVVVAGGAWSLVGRTRREDTREVAPAPAGAGHVDG